MSPDTKMNDKQPPLLPPRRPNNSFFTEPFGFDSPSFTQDSNKRRASWLIVGNGDDALEVTMRISVDSQQPTVHIQPRTGGGCIIFPLQTTNVMCGIENDPDVALNKYIKDHRARYHFLRKWETLAVYNLHALEEPVVPFEQNPTNDEAWKRLLKRSWKGTEFTLWRSHRAEWTQWPKIQAYLRNLQDELQIGLGSGERQAFWYYRLHQRTDINEPCPPPAWLFPILPDGRTAKNLAPWQTRTNFYIDAHEFRCRTIEPSKRERKVQRDQIEGIYHPGRFHRARLLQAENPAFHYMFVQLGANRDEAERNVPEIMPGTEMKFARVLSKDQIFEKGGLDCRAEVVDIEGAHDLAVFIKDPIDPLTPEEFLIATYIKANVLPITEQINALDSASYEKSFGDLPENKGMGFSLTRTILGHGTELNPDNEHHFVMDAREIDPPLPPSGQQLSSQERKHRVDYILRNFRLDEHQRKAFDASVTATTCGIHLVQGPPGTGKTTTSVVIVLALAALQHKVMLAGGSNTGVDNLSEAIVKALKEHPQIRKWAGDLIRFRTPARQIAEVRSKSSALKHRPRRGAIRSLILEKYEMHSCVMTLARDEPDLPVCKKFLQLVEDDQASPLSSDRTKELKKTYADICKILFDESNIVSTTLSNAACELFRLGYKPAFLVCDEAGQCSEGELAIALTLRNLRGVILVGDPSQLPPTVISEHHNNEGARYLKRSSMERLKKAGYPCTMLISHYRCHPEIMEFFNREFYAGSLNNMQPVDYVSRVGYIWHEFTRGHHYFHANGLVNLRRLCISVDSIATQDDNSSSWSNIGQVDVMCKFLRALYQFRTPNGMKLNPADVMVISPYKDQRVLIRNKLRELGLQVGENLTVDSVQGKEANLVFFLMTKPSFNPRSVGFISDRSRLNVSVSRAKDLLIIITNLKLWNPSAITHMKNHNHVDGQTLGRLLEDISGKGHSLTWNGDSTVEEKQAPKGCTYPHHDIRVRKARKVVSRIFVPPVPEAGMVDNPGVQSTVDWPIVHSHTVQSVSSSMHAPLKQTTPAIPPMSDSKAARQQGLGNSIHAQPRKESSGALRPGWQKSVLSSNQGSRAPPSKPAVGTAALQPKPQAVTAWADMARANGNRDAAASRGQQRPAPVVPIKQAPPAARGEPTTGNKQADRPVASTVSTKSPASLSSRPVYQQAPGRATESIRETHPVQEPVVPTPSPTPAPDPSASTKPDEDREKLRRRKQSALQRLEDRSNGFMEQLESGEDNYGDPITDTLREEIESELATLASQMMKIRLEIRRM